jgi:phage terminase large subunit GpA-like protein
MRMWEWAEQNIFMGIRQPSRIRGWYRTEYSPYVCGIFDALQDPRINRITIMKGRQTGLTLVAYIAICYWISEDPDPILYVMPNASLGQSSSEQRLQPLILDSPRVSKELTDNPDDFKKMQYNLRRCVLNIVGANSPANLASRPIRYLLLDEVDKYPEQTNREARAVNLAIERTATYEDFRKVIEFSTPTVEGGYINQAYKRGDQRKYFVLCPYCEKYFVISWKNYDWKHVGADVEKANAATYSRNELVRVKADAARIRCTHCEALLDEADRKTAVSTGKWEATEKSTDPRHVSFHLPAFNSFFETIEASVTNFLTNKDNPAELQSVVNNVFAEPWVPPAKRSVTRNRIHEVRDSMDYTCGTVPTDDDFCLVGTIDVQESHLVWNIWAMQLANQYLVDFGYLSTLDEVASLSERKYFDSQKRSHQIERALIDTGHRTMQVYETCLKHSWLIPIKGDTGRGTKQTQPVRPSAINSYPGGKLFGGNRSIGLLHLHPTFFKDQLSWAIDGEGDVRIWFPQDIDDEYVSQICGEELREGSLDKFGNRILYWHVVRRPQDHFDCAQYSFAARHLAHNTLLTLAAAPATEREVQQQAQTGIENIPSTVPEMRIDPNEVKL